MQVVILAGGYGSRLSEITSNIPKPMIEIDSRPIISHIMNHYSDYGHTDFLVALGYKGNQIKEYFSKLHLYESDLVINTAQQDTTVLTNKKNPNWNVTLVDTGLHSATGGRLLKLKPYLNEEFLMTYGDGLSNVNLEALVSQHHDLGSLATVTAVHPPARFGSLKINGNKVLQFDEKLAKSEGWINGGFFVLSKQVLNYIEDFDMPFEGKPLSDLAKIGSLNAFFHEGFWHPMDTLKDKNILEELARSGKVPWQN
jgi:glucose-1-phosphate cytidylyltransferase